MQFKSFIFSVIALVFLPSTVLSQGYFSLALVPDTQNYKGDGSNYLGSDSIEEQMKYVIRNRDRLHMAAVLGLGDVVSSDCGGSASCNAIEEQAACEAVTNIGGCLWDSGSETCSPLLCSSPIDQRWENTSNAWALLERSNSYRLSEGSGIPHSVVAGNHDCNEPQKYKCSSTAIWCDGPSDTTTCPEGQTCVQGNQNNCAVGGDGSNLVDNVTLSSSSWTQFSRYYNGWDYPAEGYTDGYTVANRWASFDWYGEQHSPARPSKYIFFTADGIRMIAIGLEYRYNYNYSATVGANAGDSLLTWVTNIITDNPGLPVVFHTHFMSEGTRSGLCNDYFFGGDDSGDNSDGETGVAAGVNTTEHATALYGNHLVNGLVLTSDCPFYETTHDVTGKTYESLSGGHRFNSWIYDNFINVTDEDLKGRVWGVFNGHFTTGNAQAGVVTQMGAPQGGQQLIESFQNFQNYQQSDPPGFFTILKIDRANSTLTKTTISPHRGDMIWSPLKEHFLNSLVPVSDPVSFPAPGPIDPFTWQVPFTLSNLTQCNDGLDNNNNGKVDFRGENNVAICSGYDDDTES